MKYEQLFQCKYEPEPQSIIYGQDNCKNGYQLLQKPSSSSAKSYMHSLLIKYVEKTRK